MLMKDHYRLAKEVWGILVKPIWQILLITFVIQLASGFALVFNPRYGHLFADFWFGAAISSFPGFAIGLLWQLYANKEVVKNNLFVVVFFVFFSIGTTLMPLVMPLDKFSF